MAARVHLDGVVGDFIKGWAVDDDAPDVPVAVEVYVGSTRLGSAVADRERKDLATAVASTPAIGFRFVLPASLLTGDERDFTVRALVDSGDRPSTTRKLATTRLPFATPAGKPWVLASDDIPSVEKDPNLAIPGVIAQVEDGNIDEAIGMARAAFLANRELFGGDTGLVEAVSRHTGVKTFEQLMADRRREWFDSGDDSVWQSQLEKKDAMHEFALRNNVQIPRQLAHFSDPAELLELDLPTRYVAKPDGLASAKGVFAVSSDVNVFTGKPITRDQIVANWQKLANETDRVDMYIVEEFVADRFAPQADVIPLDYKFYVFSGTAGFLEVFDRNYPGPSRRPYALTWRPLPMPLELGRSLGSAMREPDNLDELISVAERLGEKVGAFCRVDLFNTPDGPVLGEITTLPANGKNRTAYANVITQQAYIVFEQRRLWSTEA